MYQIVAYTTPSGGCPYEDYISKLTKKHKYKDIAVINTYKERLEKYGLSVNNYYKDTIEHLRDKIWELRPGNTRTFFFMFDGDKIVFLHAIEKKRWDIPHNEIKTAIKEMNDYLERYKDEK